MKLTDMIKLGAKGFKPADIKELESSNIQTDELIKLAENGYSISDVKELIALAGTDESSQPGNDDKKDPEGPPDKSGNDGEEQLNDKEKALKTEVDELKKKLAALQDQTASKNLGGEPKDPRKDVQEIFKQLY